MLQQGLKCFKEIFLFYFIFFLETFQSHRGFSIAYLHDSYAKASMGLKCFKKKIKNKKFNFFFQVRQSLANARDRTKFNNWNFTSKLFSRNQEWGACSMSIQPTSGSSRRVRRHSRRGRRYGSRQYSYLVCKHLGSKLKSNLSECSYLYSSLRCRIHTSLPR
jgi:hypothetical protein